MICLIVEGLLFDGAVGDLAIFTLDRVDEMGARC